MDTRVPRVVSQKEIVDKVGDACLTTECRRVGVFEAARNESLYHFSSNASARWALRSIRLRFPGQTHALFLPRPLCFSFPVSFFSAIASLLIFLQTIPHFPKANGEADSTCDDFVVPVHHFARETDEQNDTGTAREVG